MQCNREYSKDKGNRNKGIKFDYVHLFITAVEMNLEII